MIPLDQRRQNHQRQKRWKRLGRHLRINHGFTPGAHLLQRQHQPHHRPANPASPGGRAATQPIIILLLKLIPTNQARSQHLVWTRLTGINGQHRHNQRQQSANELKRAQRHSSWHHNQPSGRRRRGKEAPMRYLWVYQQEVCWFEGPSKNTLGWKAVSV